MIPGDFKRLQIALNDFKWFHMISNDFEYMIGDDFNKLCQTISNVVKWSQVFQVFAKDSGWFQMI